MKLKNIFTRLVLPCFAAASLSSCMQDITTTTEYATASHIAVSEKALMALANGPAAYMYAYEYFGVLASQEFGYPAMMLMRDALTDCPYVSTNYNHFSTPWATLSDFTSSRTAQPWRYYYQMIFNANLTITAFEDPENADEALQQLLGNALVYRAMSYLDLMRMYEYKSTGVAALDAEADAKEIWGLTSVIVDEHFNVANATNNPRAPFYRMYRFIMNDLNRAERYLANYTRENKTWADLSVVQAYKARLWLEIATRFQKYPQDLATQLAHEDDDELDMYDALGITTAADCYRNAAEYARLVINKYTPLSREQWHSTTDGFNNINSQNSWIFGILIKGIDAVHSRTNAFHSNCDTEYSRGYSRSQYHCYRMIDKSLYDRISDSDWRKVTWIDPADAGATPTPSKYYTLLDNDEWKVRDAYVGFKFRPNEGDTSDDYTNALQTDFPVIRVEEMYFIEAEALAYSQSMAAGISALTSFLNTYRYTDGSYSVNADSVDEFVDSHLITQKRIELWGEGLSYFDIKRRELRITRGYAGTNWLSTVRYNSHVGHTPSWLNFYVPDEREAAMNKAVKLNPNPSVVDSYGLWTN